MSDSFSDLAQISQIKRQVIDLSPSQSIYNYTLYFEEQGFLASGSALCDQLARKKAYSEAIERLFFRSLQPPNRAAWRFDLLNSTDCMAAGFSLPETVKRSNFEAIERNCRILFEERKLPLYSVSLENLPCEAQSFIQQKMTDLQVTCLPVESKTYENFSIQGYFTIALEKKDGEVFLGYAFNDNLELGILQATFEAYRNKIYLETARLEKENKWIDSQYLQSILKTIDAKVESKTQFESSHREAPLLLPKIAWQNVAKFNRSYICRSFVLGFLDMKLGRGSEQS